MPEKKEKQLNTSELEELVNFIHANQSEANPKTHLQITLLLTRYSTAYSLPAMYRYLQWALKNAQAIGQIKATIGHDLNGFTNGEKFFSPRTESY